MRLSGGELAKGSWEQVAWAVKIVHCLDREVATTDEARQILEMKPRF